MDGYSIVRQQELERKQMLSQINQKYYETMEEQHFEIRRLKHDLANHLHTLLLTPKEQQTAYMKELLEHTLDNAIEACKLLEREQRVISLETHMQKGLFVLSVKNQSHLQLEAGILPVTTKRNTKEHGIGLRSIKEITERYEGQLEIVTEHGIFEVFLYLPIKAR